MKMKIKAVEITFIEEEFEGSPSDCLYQFAKAHPKAIIEYIDYERPDGRIERVYPENLKSEIVFPTSSPN